MIIMTALGIHRACRDVRHLADFERGRRSAGVTTATAAAEPTNAFLMTDLLDKSLNSIGQFRSIGICCRDDRRKSRFRVLRGTCRNARARSRAPGFVVAEEMHGRLQKVH
jgi:hypothetical protein